MRTQLLIATALAFAATGCIVEHDIVREPSQASQFEAAPPPPQEDADASAEVISAPPVERNVDTQVFYDRLSPYGHWEYTPEYGRVWVPSVAANWHPYYYGHWVYTDWGWTFASDDPWGWAAYHYGSWGYGPALGWYWVPGSVWAPAWVSWRYGGGYVTWCPIGPRGYAYGYNSPGWVAVHEQHFTQPIATSAVPVHATGGIVQSASPLAGPHATPVRGGSFGPPVAQVAAATGQQIHPVSAASAVGRPQPRAVASNGDSYRKPGSDPIRSPAPRASASPSARTSQAGSAAPVARSSGGDAVRSSGDSARGLGAGRGGSDAPAARGLGGGPPAARGAGSAPAARGLGSDGAPAARGLGSDGAPAARGLGSGGARGGGNGGSPRQSSGGAPAPRGSGAGGAPRSSAGGGYHPAPAPAPAARPSGGAAHSRK